MEHVDKPKFDDFLNHVGLRRDTKLTLKDVKVVKIYSSSQAEKDDMVYQFFTHLQAEDRQVIQKLHSSVTSQQSLSHISVRDFLFAILNCCDPLLMQYVLYKLHSLGSAIPILMPNVDNGNVYFLQQAFRPFFQSHAPSNRQTLLPADNFINVSAFRFGDLNFSKSDVLNKVLAMLQCNVESIAYVSYVEDPKPTVWSKGTLDVTVFTPSKGHTMPEIPSFLLFNLRGDGLQHIQQQRFCACVSQIQIVFLSQHSDENQKHIRKMTKTSHVILVTDNAKHKEKYRGAKKRLKIIHCKSTSSQEISKLLLRSLVKRVKNVSKHFKSSMESLTNACIKLNFIDDEQKFQRSKRLAQEVVDDIPFNFLQNYKKQMMHFTRSCRSLDNFTDLVDDSFCRDNQEKCFHEVAPKHVEKLLRCFKFANNEQPIFFTSLYQCLEHKFGERLQLCTDRYINYFEKTVHLHKVNEKKEGIEEAESHSKIWSEEQQLVQELSENTVKVEQFLCLLWQYLRSSHATVDNYFNSSTYNECINTWLMNGNSIDLVGMNLCLMPSPWALRLLNQLQYIREDRTRTRVVAAFGGKVAQSCKLLNHVFGTNFTQSDSLCSGGIRMQLIPIQNTSESSLAFDYLLLLNINAISLAEIVLGSYSRMREYILTLMSSITDVLVIYLNKDELHAEESIMFDMIVHTVIKFRNSVLSKCCVVYQVKSSDYFNQDELQSYTQGMLEKTCNKIPEREPSSCKQTYSKKSTLRKNVLSCFINEGTINVKVLPRVQSISSNQDYVKSIKEMKKFILLLLQQCQREACTLEGISQTIFSQTYRMSGKANISQQTPFHKFVSPSSQVCQYHVINSMKDITRKVSHAASTGSTTIATAHNKENAGFRLKNDILEVVNNEVEEMRKFLTFVAEHNKFLSDDCNTLLAKLLNYKENQLHFCFKELDQAVEVAIENDNIDRDLEIKTEKALATMRTIQEGERDSLLVEEQIDNCIEEYISNMNKEYPESLLSEIRSRIKRRIIDELKRNKYGKHVHTFINTTVFDDWCDHSRTINSIDDVRKLEKRFNIEDKTLVTAFLECQGKLSEFSTDYVHFTSNFEKVMTSLKRYLQTSQDTVDSLTMCIFLCIKFISSVHMHHVRADIKHKNFSASDIDFQSYIVTMVEPLEFPSLTSKLAYTKPFLKTLLTGDDVSYLANALRSPSVTNYGHIPSNLLTIQRLDRRFLYFLPVMSSHNLNYILHVVNDTKLYCLGTALGNFGYDLDELLEKIFNLIKHSLINGRDSEAIKAAAIVHVSVWSWAILSVKEYEKESTTNLTYCARKLVQIFKLNIRFAKQPLEKEFAQIVCEAMEDALLKCILQELQRKLREFLLQRSHVIILKRSLTGQMLRSFCIQGDFEQFLSFVENYNHCSRKYILVFLVKQINDETNSFIWNLKTNVIEEKIESAIEAVKQATLHCVETSNYSLCAWIQTFKTYFVDLKDKRFKYLEKHVQFSDVDAFAEHCCSILGNMKHRLNDRIELPEKGNIDSTKTFLFSLSRNMHEEFSSYIIGCIEQCPLCGNTCEFDLVNHEYHSVLPHIPIGIKGGRDRESDELISVTCPSLVSKNNVLTSLDLEDDAICKLSTFMTNIHPTWHIQDAENDPNVFWKYIFNRFNRQFAEFYECREGNLPPEWKEYSKDDAIRSVERTYKLEQNEFMSHQYAASLYMDVWDNSKA